MTRLIANALLFQLGWFVCVLGGNKLALAWICPYLLFHFYYVSQTRREWLFLLAVTAIGVSLDSVALKIGMFSLPGNGFFPIWLVCLWICFATLIPHGLSWLQGRPVLAALFGAVGGSLSYAAGIKLGAANSINTNAAIIYWAAQWAILLPSLLFVAKWWLVPPAPMPGSGWRPQT